MTMIPASFVIILEEVDHVINFSDLNDFRRILREDLFEQTENTDTVEIYRPTKERHKGKLNLLYLISSDRLASGTVYILSGKED